MVDPLKKASGNSCELGKSKAIRAGNNGYLSQDPESPLAWAKYNAMDLGLSGEAHDVDFSQPVSEKIPGPDETMEETQPQTSRSPHLKPIPSLSPKNTPLNRQKWKRNAWLLGLRSTHKLLSHKRTGDDNLANSQCLVRDKVCKLVEVSDVFASALLIELVGQQPHWKP